MQEILTPQILEYLDSVKDETIALIETLCRIPAPSHLEDERAKFIKQWLEKQGAKGVYIDEAKNVVYPVGCENKNDIILFSAHTDTVFPDLEEMPFSNDGEYLYSPGVGDDTTCLAVLLMAAKYVAQNNLQAPCGILFVANACEEGLGNLKGIKQIMRDYTGRISRAYTFDGQYDALVTKCVGSHRYELTLTTEGGHSFRDFGNRNAIVAAAKLIALLNECEISTKSKGNTTFNFGLIEGGTSVNTIAQSVKFCYEYRSDQRQDLEQMQTFFFQCVETARKEKWADIAIKTLGERPCGGKINESELQEMIEQAVQISQKHSGIECKQTSGSTDCNILMSLGVPAVCVGSYLGHGEHTREEKVLISSIPVGLKIAFELVLGYFI